MKELFTVLASSLYLLHCQHLVGGNALSLRQLNKKFWGTLGNKIVNLRTLFSFQKNPSPSRSDEELKAGIADFYDKVNKYYLIAPNFS